MTDVLFDVLQTKELDIAYCMKRIGEVKIEIEKYRNDAIFKGIWEDVNSRENVILILPTTKRRNRGPVADLDAETKAKRLFNEIFDNVLTQLNERFENLSRLKFLSLLDPTNRNSVDEKLQNLRDSYGDIFDYVRLKNELAVLYTFDQLKNLSPYQLVHVLKTENLDGTLKEVYKLGVMILTIPSTTASVERSFSALKRINSYQRSTQGQERLSGLSLMSIEKELLIQVMANSVKFYQNVIKNFVKKDRRMDFIFK